VEEHVCAEVNGPNGPNELGEEVPKKDEPPIKDAVVVEEEEEECEEEKSLHMSLRADWVQQHVKRNSLQVLQIKPLMLTRRPLVQMTGL
jgi:hypothetical protein